MYFSLAKPAISMSRRIGAAKLGARMRSWFCRQPTGASPMLRHGRHLPALNRLGYVLADLNTRSSVTMPEGLHRDSPHGQSLRLLPLKLLLTVLSLIHHASPSRTPLALSIRQPCLHTRSATMARSRLDEYAKHLEKRAPCPG